MDYSEMKKAQLKVPKGEREGRMKTITRISVMLLLAFALLAACRPQEVKKPPDEISVRLKWYHQAQFAGMYVADDKGFYADENIEVTLHPGAHGISPIDLVLTGPNDFGITSAGELLIARAEGKPVRAIAVIYRISPLVYIALQSSGIERPQDFVNKRIAVASTAQEIHRALMTKLGIDMSTMSAVPFQADVSPLIAGEVDVMNAYVVNRPYLARKEGYEVNIIYPHDYGIHFYDDILFTSEATIEQKPQLVERFLRATLRGWRYAIENPEEMVTLALKYDDELDRGHQLYMIETSIPLIHTGEDQIGWMRAEVWQGMHDMLLEQGILDGPVDLDKVYTIESSRGAAKRLVSMGFAARLTPSGIPSRRISF